MALPGSGEIQLSEIQTEFGGSNPIQLSEYYSKGNAPASGEIQLAADFWGTSAGLTWSTDDSTAANESHGAKAGVIGSCLMAAWDNGTARKETQEHNGTSWSAGGSLATAHGVGGGGGTQTAAAVYGGYDGSDETDVCEEYNGSSWSSGGTMVAGMAYTSGGGKNQSAQLCTGGSSYGPTVRDLSTTQTYNATSWTNESVASSGQGSGIVVGTADDYLLYGGALDSPGSQEHSFSFNGSSWTTEGNMAIKRRYFSGWGEPTAAYAVGGVDASSPWDCDGSVEYWDDSTWSSDTAPPGERYAAGYGGGESGTGGFIVAGQDADGLGNTTNHNDHYTAA